MIHATSSKPPRRGAASMVAPYFAANQLMMDLSDPPPANCACSSAIIGPELGQLTWLHSSNICPQLQAHIMLWPSLLNLAPPSAAPNITTARKHTTRLCVHRVRDMMNLS